MCLRGIFAVVAAFGLFAFGAEEKRVGIIGCDTSHALAFTKLLNASDEAELAGYRVTCAYKWGSRDIFSSTNRYPRYIAELEGLGVKMAPSIAALLDEVDAVLLETNDGRPHLEQAREVFKSGKPVFIDKPLAASLADVVQLVAAGTEMRAKWFCSSALRYVKNVQAARAGAFGAVRGADCWSPEEFEPTQSEFFWYAIHAAEPLFAVMGRGCREVRATGTATEDVAVGTWADGRLGVMRALNYSRPGACHGGVVFTARGAQDLGTYEGYKPLLVEIVKFFRTGEVPVAPEETLEIYAFLEAATQSKAKGGAPVKIADVLKKAKEVTE